jgi:hypothetical protein
MGSCPLTTIIGREHPGWSRHAGARDSVKKTGQRELTSFEHRHGEDTSRFARYELRLNQGLKWPDG